MKKLFVILAMAALACALPAAADTITFDGTSGNSQGGVSTVSYLLSINGAADINAMCVDFDQHITTGESWDGTVTNMASGDLSNTRLGTAGFAIYREQAWLYNEFLIGAGPSGDINFAVWALTSADAKTSAGWTAGAQQWLDLANTTDLANFSTVNFNIISPRDLTGTGPQEFIAPTATPEPAGLLLLGSGMLGLAGFGKKTLQKLR